MTQKAPDVEAFHRKNETVIFNDGTSAPITKWFDAEGDECGPFDHPVTATAGPDANGEWHSFLIADFYPVETH